jgi:hypothetical protein
MSNLNYAFRHSNISTLPQISNQIFTSKFILSNLNYASRHSNMPTWHQICTQKSQTITHTSVGFRNFKLHIWITSTTGRVCRWRTLLKLPLPVVFSLGIFKWQTGSSNFTSLHIMVIAHQCLTLSRHTTWPTLIALQQKRSIQCQNDSNICRLFICLTTNTISYLPQ